MRDDLYLMILENRQETLQHFANNKLKYNKEEMEILGGIMKRIDSYIRKLKKYVMSESDRLLLEDIGETKVLHTKEKL